MKSIKVFTIAALLVVISLSGPGIGKAAVALPIEETEMTLNDVSDVKDNSLVEGSQFSYKIPADLYEKALRKDGKYLIYVWRKGIDFDKVKETLLDETGYDCAVYDNDDSYESEVVARIRSKLEEKYGKDFLESSDENEEGKTLLRNTCVEDYRKYISSKRRVITKICTDGVDSFIKYFNIPDSDIYLKNNLTGTLIIYATKDKIEEIVTDESVTDVSPYKDAECCNELNRINGQVRTDDVTGTKSSLYNNGNGYTGMSWQCAGVIEYNGRFDSTWPHLLQNNHAFFPVMRPDGTSATYSIKPHATLVTSIIVGSSVTLDSRRFYGVAPNVTAYQSPFNNETDVIRAFNSFMASDDVTAINMSASAGVSDGYVNIDREIDNSVRISGISFVKSAGNQGDFPAYTWNVTSPGKGLNVIAVGAADTKSDAYVSKSSPYNMTSYSSYKVAEGLPDKPDVCAPGNNIACVTSSNSVYYDSGTSFAAPIVTGTILQLQECDWRCVGNPMRVKALIVLGASNSSITTANGNAPVPGNSNLGKVSGAGLINAKKVMDVALAGTLNSYSIPLYNMESDDFFRNMVYLDAGDKLRAVLVFGKCDGGTIGVDGYGIDMDLSLYKSDGETLCVTSCSYSNNTEIIEYTAAASGWYFIDAEVYSLLEYEQGMTPLEFTVAWDVT